MIRRYQDWPTRLDRAIREIADRPFGYGSFDCGLALADLVRAMTGTDLAKDYRGYTGKTEALRLLAEHGGVEGFMVHIMSTHGLEEVLPPFAQRGDCVLVDTAEGPAAGVVDLSGRHAVLPGETSGWRQATPPWLRAWRLP